jgi:transketolase
MHDKLEELSQVADQMRLRIIDMVVKAKGGHLGGAFSVLEILVALYLGGVLRYDPKRPGWEGRDRLILSKGHSCMALYSILAFTGYFPSEMLDQYCEEGGILAGHPEHDMVPGVEVTTGSLGHGLPIAVGLAMGAKLTGKDWKVYCILGDGECNEGSVWEGFMAGPQFKLDKLVAIIDSNKLESLDLVENILSIEPLAERLRNFGWNVHEVDGHDIGQLLAVLRATPKVPGKPSAIVAHTVKGRGVDFMEGVAKWHHRKLTTEEAQASRRQINERLPHA